MPPSSAIARSGSSSGLPWNPFLSSTSATPWPLSVRAITSVGPPVVAIASAYARSISSTSCPSIAIACQPNARAPLDVDVEIPPDHRLAALPEPVHVEDRREVVELVVRAVLEGLPDRALGRLAVAAQDPDAVRKPVEVLPGERHPDADRQTLSERAGRDVHPRDERGRMSFEAAPEPAVRHQLLVRDRARRLVDRVQERRGVALGEDETVVLRRASGASKS